MRAEHANGKDERPLLLCFDGSDEAEAAIANAGRLLAPRKAVGLTTWEPVAGWEPYDPATVLTAPLARLASHASGLDEIVSDLAKEKIPRGVTLATEAGFDATGRVAKGKAWRTTCDVATELDADLIVLGARGLGRVQSVLLGSVASAVLVPARRSVLVVPPQGDETP